MPEYPLPDGHFVCRRTGGVLDFNNRNGDPSAVVLPDKPRVVSPMPSFTMVQDQPFAYNAAVNFSSSEPLLFSWINIATGLQGFTDGRLEGTPDRATVPGAPLPCTVTVTDPFGQQASSNFEITVVDIVTPPPNEDRKSINWPNCWASFNSSSVRTVYLDRTSPTEPSSGASATQKATSYLTEVQVCQGDVGVGSADGRRQWRLRSQHWVDRKLPYAKIVDHIDWGVVPGDRPDATGAYFGRAKWDYMVQDPDDCLLSAAGTKHLGHRSTASLPTRNMDPKMSRDFMRFIMQRYLGQVLYNSDPTQDLSDRRVFPFCDALKFSAVKHSLALHLVVVSSKSDAGSGTQAFVMPKWASANAVSRLTGRMDAAGYETYQKPHHFLIRPNKTVWGDAGMTSSIKGVKYTPDWPIHQTSTAYDVDDYVSTSSGRTFRCVRAGTTGASQPVWPRTVGGQVDDGDTVAGTHATWQYVGVGSGANMTIRASTIASRFGANDVVQIMFTGGDTSGGIWPTTGNQTVYGYTEMQGRVAAYATSFDYINELLAEILTARGLPPKNFGRCFNAINGSFLTKRQSGVPASHPWMGLGDIVHNEHANLGRNEDRGFTYRRVNGVSQPGFRYGYLTETDIKYLLEKVVFGCSFLKRGEPLTDLEFRCVVGSVHLGKYVAIDNPGQTAVAFMDSWAGFMVMASGGNYYPNFVYGTSHKTQAVTALIHLALGGAPVTEASLFANVLDPGSPLVPDTTDDYLTRPDWHYSMQWALLDAYDPDGNSNKGTSVMRANDWGARAFGQWSMWYPGKNGWPIRFRLNHGPISSVDEAWAPGKHVDAALDTFTLETPPGWCEYSIDLTDYPYSESGHRYGYGYMASVDGEAVNIKYDETKYPPNPNAPPGIGYPIGGTGKAGATGTLGPGDFQATILAPEGLA